MDLNEMRNRLQTIQSKSSGKSGEKKSVFWKPSIGKQVIRVVPSKYNKLNPFTEMYFHYGIGKNTMVSPINWGEKDPIVEFAKQLRQTSDKENWRLAKKVEPKMRIFVPVIVRGEESEGVKLWQFGKELYMDFLNLADNEDVGDFTDVSIGRDITLTTVGPEVTGTNYNKTTIMPKVKETPLAASKDEVKALLENQPNPMEVFKRYSFDEMKSALQEWLTPEEPEEGSIIDDEKEEEVAPVTTGKAYSIKTPAAAKVSKADKFDSLFEDEEAGDLPWEK
jgi:hypothetical protein